MVAAVFLCGWMLAAYFILVNILIAALSESLVLSEAQKVRKQVEAYLADQDQPAFPRWHRRFSTHLDPSTRKDSSYDGLPQHLQAALADPVPATPAVRAANSERTCDCS